MSIFHQIIPDVQTAALSIRKLMIVHAVFSSEQTDRLAEYEHTCSSIRDYSARYGFLAGLYCGFKQYFSPEVEDDGGFMRYVNDEIGYRAAIAILEKVEPQNWPAPAMERKIVSNNMAAKVREVPIGKRTFIVRRPVVPVNEENVYVLQLLDLLKNLDVYLDESYDVAHDKVSQFVRIHGITKKDVDSYIREFPIGGCKIKCVS